MNPLLIDPPRIRQIIGLESDPARRNLLITQSYHDLATALSLALGQQNANWCHFACWASCTAGTFIRNEQIPGLFRSLIEKSRGYRETTERLANDIDDLPVEGHITLGELIGGIAANISTCITQGNLAVYSELAPLFSLMIEQLPPSHIPAAEKLAAIQSTLKEGDTPSGGQQLLRDAVANYFKAQVTSDPAEKAQVILLANAQVGLHEQIRLQPYIQKSLAALFEESIEALHHNLTTPRPKNLKRRLYLAVLHLMLHPLEGKLQELWEKLATDILMTLKVPDETLRLGKPLPPPRGLPLYPAALSEIRHEELRHLLLNYDALTMKKREVAAKDWTRLEERMCYILNLFRSRQQVATLFQPPFPQSAREGLAGTF